MKSSNMAMSKFKHYSIESLYDNLCEGFNDQKKEMTDKNFKDIRGVNIVDFNQLQSSAPCWLSGIFRSSKC